MNYSIIIYIYWIEILSWKLFFMLLPCATALIYRESGGSRHFLLTMAVCLAVGLPLTRKKPGKKAFYTKEGFVTAALSWGFLSVMGALPLSSAAVFRIR